MSSRGRARRSSLRRPLRSPRRRAAVGRARAASSTFACERYALYTADGGRLYRAELHHLPWQLAPGPGDRRGGDARAGRARGRARTRSSPSARTCSSGRWRSCERRHGASRSSRSAAAALLVALKLSVGLEAHSLGLVSEAVHSGTDLVAALLTFFALGVAGRPADRGHQYGHGKAEHLAALAEAAFLSLASVLIALRALERLFGSGQAHVEVQRATCSRRSAS